MSNRSDKRFVSGQTGSSLVELMVGIAVGLLVVTAALGTLVLSRVTSLAVSDQLELQQQANTAIRIMAGQVREASTRELDPTIAGMFQFTPIPVFTGNPGYVQGFARDANNNDDFGVAFADAAPPPNGTRDCLGNTNAVWVNGTVVTNRYSVVNNQLMCLGVNAATGAQPIIELVQRLRVLYAVQNTTVTPVTLTYLPQALVPVLSWANGDVVGMEICIELASAPRGSEFIPGNYTDCDGALLPFDGRVRAFARQTVRMRAVQDAL